MESNELRLKRVGLSSDGVVIFCEMDNGKTYSMPLDALEGTENWGPEEKAQAIKIIDDGYAAVVELDSGMDIDFATDFVLHICEPSYPCYKGKDRTASDIGARIRLIREARGLTLDAMAAKCGIAKPNLSRLENDKLTPTFETLRAVAAALDTHPVLLVAAKKPEDAWKWTQHEFIEWKLNLRSQEAARSGQVNVSTEELVNTFLATRPEHDYARAKLAKYAGFNTAGVGALLLDAEKWASEKAVAQTAKESASVAITTAHNKIKY
jgi:transcriptional regulator with XRE-family HTH domain